MERRKGRFEQAQGGTLFLDEIGELPAEMLLRVPQQREFERLGGNQTVRVDVRLVAATNRDLAAEVQAGRFRNGLYYRLNVFPIRVPALRERPADIPLLVAHFAEKHGTRFGRPISRIDRRSMAQLEAYSWPGQCARAGKHRRACRNPLTQRHATRGEGTASGSPSRQAIDAALRASHGRIAGLNGAARRLGLPASTLDSRIRRLGIDKFRYRREAA
jgi:formate hydrogenlyase transcriptional activator